MRMTLVKHSRMTCAEGTEVVRQAGGQSLPLGSPLVATVYAAYGHCQQLLRAGASAAASACQQVARFALP